MRAVIDNDVLVSGLLWGDKPGRVLAAVARGHVQIFLSEELLAELREVLRRGKFAARLALRELLAFKGSRPEGLDQAPKLREI